LETSNKLDSLISKFSILDILYFECEDGWFDLINSLLKDLEEISLTIPKEKRFKIVQVKEKFGRLRCYLSCYPEEIKEELSRIIGEAEHRSSTICEICGKPARLGTIGDSYWLKTLCVECRQPVSSPFRKQPT